jgi:hypothetical protein
MGKAESVCPVTRPVVQYDDLAKLAASVEYFGKESPAFVPGEDGTDELMQIAAPQLQDAANMQA